MEDGAVDIFETFQYSEDESAEKFEDVIKKFEQYCQPRQNVVFDRFKFFSRSQDKDETVDKYVTELKKLSSQCNFGEQTEFLIRERSVLGINDKTVQERLLRDADLKLAKALDYCRSSEASRKQVIEITGSSAREASIVNKEKNKAKSKSKKCGFNHDGEKKCPAMGKTCLKCKKKNHFAGVCENQKRVKEIREENDFPEEDQDILAVRKQTKVVSAIARNEILHINGKPISFKIAIQGRR
ncbi:hypothetical protein RI129_005649 [Pyrocoelia pectoralis]|uniref:Uncharacterized protein n=1 Tax=Pyrocoelia pectoralis TaxID=417401 RepID=A0AAN7VDS0_9COLE